MDKEIKIEHGGYAGILYNSVQENNIRVEIRRCKEIGMNIEIFESPVKTEIDLMYSYNSHGFCYGHNYLFSASSIRHLREMYQADINIENLLRTRVWHDTGKEAVIVPVFSERIIEELWRIADLGEDPSEFMTLRKDLNGKEVNWPLYCADEIREIALARRLGLDYAKLMEQGQYGLVYSSETMRLMIQAMVRKLPSLSCFLQKGTDGKLVFEPMTHSILNHVAINLPDLFEVISSIDKEGKASFSYSEMFYAVSAYEMDIPSKSLFLKLTKKGKPKLSLEKMISIYEAEKGALE